MISHQHLYVRALVRDIESGTLEGADCWRQVHERGFGRVPPPFAPDDSPEQGMTTAHG
jgi:hypothetical protein